VLDALRKIEWDWPYRMLASLAGLATAIVCLCDTYQRPSQVILAVLHWLGVDARHQVSEVINWMTAPQRAHLLKTAAAPISLAGIFLAITSARRRGNLDFSRALPTTLIAWTIYVELAGAPTLITWSGVKLVCLILVLLYFGRRNIDRWGEALLIVVVNLAFSIGFALIIPLAWAIFEDPRSSRRKADSSLVDVDE
jgi:hypothetical protein